MKKTSKHADALTLAINESVVQFGFILAERVEVALMKIGRVSPRTLKKWMKAAGTDDLLKLAEMIRTNCVKQQAMNAAEESAPENELADEPAEEGTNEGTVEDTDSEGSEDVQ